MRELAPSAHPEMPYTCHFPNITGSPFPIFRGFDGCTALESYVIVVIKELEVDRSEMTTPQQ
jgi:hypothetical protein